MMKKIFYTVVFILLISAPSQAEIKSMNLQIDGLSCPFCALSLEKKLKSVPAVATVDVHLKKASTDLTFKSGNKLNLSAIRKAVKEAGFTLKDIQVTVSGSVIQDKNGLFIVESQGDKMQFYLFDESHTDANPKSFNSHMLNTNLEKQLLKAQEEKKEVKVEGIIHQHADMPFSLLIKNLELKSE